MNECGKLEEQKIPCIEVWKVIAARRQARDSMIWQTAGLVFTGQAFLYSIALGKDTYWIARLIAFVLSIVAAFATMQVMAKHRVLEEIDSKSLKDFESETWKTAFHNKKTENHTRFWIRWSSVDVWIWLQWVFVAVSSTLFLVLVFYKLTKFFLFFGCNQFCCD